jgi:hypothetical protein
MLRPSAQQGDGSDNPPSVGAASAAAAPKGQAISNAAPITEPLGRSDDLRPATVNAQLQGYYSTQVVDLSQPDSLDPVPKQGTGVVAMKQTQGPADSPPTESKSPAHGASPRTKTVPGVPGAVPTREDEITPTVKPADDDAYEAEKLPTDAQHDLTKIFEQFDPGSPEYMQTAFAACQALMQAMTMPATTLWHSIRVQPKDKLQLPEAWVRVGYDPRIFDETKLCDQGDLESLTVQVLQYLLHLVSAEHRRKFHAMSLREALGPENTVNWGAEVRRQIEQSKSLPRDESGLAHRCMTLVDKAVETYEMAQQIERKAHRHLLDAIEAFDGRFPDAKHLSTFGAIMRRYWIDRRTYKDDLPTTRFIEAVTARIFEEHEKEYLRTCGTRPVWAIHFDAIARYTSSAYKEHIEPSLLKQEERGHQLVIPGVPNSGMTKGTDASSPTRTKEGHHGQGLRARSPALHAAVAREARQRQVDASTDNRVKQMRDRQLQKLWEQATDTFERVHTAHLPSDWDYDSQDSDAYCSRDAPDDPDDQAEADERELLRKRTRARKALKQAERKLIENAARYAPRSLRSALTTCSLKLDSQPEASSVLSTYRR